MQTQNFTPLDLSKFKKPAKTPLIFSPVFFVISLVITLGLTFYFFYQYQKSQSLLSKAALDNTSLLVKIVGSLAILPEKESPTIATIIDKSQLPNQPFFKNAQNGDKIIIYTLAKKAILYRPALNKIVDIGPVNMDENVSGASTSTKISSGSGRIIYRPISPSPAREEIDASGSPTLEPSPR